MSGFRPPRRSYPAASSNATIAQLGGWVEDDVSDDDDGYDSLLRLMGNWKRLTNGFGAEPSIARCKPLRTFLVLCAVGCETSTCLVEALCLCLINCVFVCKARTTGLAEQT